MKKKAVHLNIGDYRASATPAILSTILGSCVAVCLYDPVRKIGGMNHILMPGRADMKNFNQAARFGINAMELLINQLFALSSGRMKLIGKVFGGGTVIPSISEAFGMGPKNIDFAFAFLENEGIEVASYDVGGRVSRKLYFHTDTGEVFLKRMEPRLLNELAQREEAKRQQIAASLNKPVDITLFDR